MGCLVFGTVLITKYNETRRCTKNAQKKSLRELIDKAVEKSEALDVAFAVRRMLPPKAGDSFSFNLGEGAMYLFWVLISQHPDDSEIWYLVPDDGFSTSLVGSSDVEVPETDLCGPAVVRANCGLWAKLKSINAKGQRSSFIPDEYVNQARKVLACLAKGVKPENIKPKQEECDCDSDYEDLIDEINVARTALDKMLNG
mgnify:FL=1